MGAQSLFELNWIQGEA